MINYIDLANILDLYEDYERIRPAVNTKEFELPNNKENKSYEKSRENPRNYRQAP